MGEYEDRYPEAYGHDEASVLAPRPGPARQVRRGLLRGGQTRGGQTRGGQTRGGLGGAEQIPRPRAAPAPSLPPRRFSPRAQRPLPPPPPERIAAEVREALSANPFIDAGDVTITVRGAEVTLSGTINSLIAVSMAHSLAANVDGVSRVELRLRVPRGPAVHRSAD